MKYSECVIVTGASSGLGKEMYKFLKEYYKGQLRVHGVARNGPTDYINLLDSRSRDIFLQYIKETYKKVRLIINNAGVLNFNDDTDKNLAMLHLNLWEPYMIIEYLFKNNLLNSGSQIINIGSVSGIKGEQDAPLYAATKAGLHSLTKSYAKKWSIDGIRVNTISPGFFKTNLVSGKIPDELLQSIPLKREAQPIELIPVLKMLIETPYMTGANIVIDGGLLL